MFKKYAVARKLRLGVDVKACKDCQGPERPCLVDGKPATFHRWAEEDRGILQLHAFTKPGYIDQMRREYEEKNIIPAGASLEKLRSVKALVEWPDGSVSTVGLELITFLDRREG